MNRKDTTAFLSNLLINQRLLGNYWASEVTLNYGSEHPKRVDFMQFSPVNTFAASGIEKGYFTCYEIKSCMADYRSGHGQNFIAEKNYFVMSMALYKGLIVGNPSTFGIHVGVIVPIPKGSNKLDEFENPTKLDNTREWELITIKNSYPQDRHYSIVELLFCMLRSGKGLYELKEEAYGTENRT